MSNRLYYKGYYTDVKYEAEDQTLHGIIEGIKDFVNYSTTDATLVETEFHNAVDDYLLLCEETGKTPEVPYSGVFNVRIPPDLHRRIAIQAFESHQTLNALVKDTLQRAFL